MKPMTDTNQKQPQVSACPFCGKENPRVYQAGGYWKIKCVDGCEISISGYPKKADALTAWNRRPADGAGVEELVRAATRFLKLRADGNVNEFMLYLDAILDDMETALRKIPEGDAEQTLLRSFSDGV